MASGGFPSATGMCGCWRHGRYVNSPHAKLPWRPLTLSSGRGGGVHCSRLGSVWDLWLRGQTSGHSPCGPVLSPSPATRSRELFRAEQAGPVSVSGRKAMTPTLRNFLAPVRILLERLTHGGGRGLATCCGERPPPHSPVDLMAPSGDPLGRPSRLLADPTSD